MTAFYILLMIFFGISNTENANTIIPIELIGTWKLESSESDTYEVWEENGAGEIEGYSFVVISNDTTVFERLEIKYIDNVMYYLANVPDQNNGETIKFRLTESNVDSFVFENPGHDFPRIINYIFINDDKIKVILKGLRQERKK